MFASSLSRRLAARGLHYGWVVVAVAFVVALTTAGAMGLPGALLRPLEREFGWSAADISSALALRILLFGLMAPFAAALMERYGLRRVILCAIAMISAGLIAAMFMTQLWQLVVLWGIVVGLGTGMTALVMAAIISTRWFSERRGLVVGVLSASSATGQLVFLPLAAAIEARWGWRAAVFPTLGGLLVAAAGVALLMADRPADLGLAPYGAKQMAPPPPPAPAFSTPFRVLGEIATVPAFWVLAGTFFVCGLSTNGLIQTHFIAFCGDYGIAAVTAASVLAMMGVFDFFGTIGSGWLSDRVDNRALLFMYYGLRGLALLYLPASSFSIPSLSLFALFYGLDWIATVPPTVRLTADTFGANRAGVAFGWVFASHMVGASVAAYAAGVARTSYGAYTPAFYIAGAACIVAALSVWLLAARRRPALKTAAA
ncbi:MAG: MFS transporter [Pseudomonadota bacterium]|nr:MFS transporter [Pseudomonadota bacterium]